jgi:hypothetical protein
MNLLLTSAEVFHCVLILFVGLLST